MTRGDAGHAVVGAQASSAPLFARSVLPSTSAWVSSRYCNCGTATVARKDREQQLYLQSFWWFTDAKIKWRVCQLHKVFFREQNCSQKCKSQHRLSLFPIGGYYQSQLSLQPGLLMRSLRDAGFISRGSQQFLSTYLPLNISASLHPKYEPGK